MARKNSTYRFFPVQSTQPEYLTADQEFDESDIWGEPKPANSAQSKPKPSRKKTTDKLNKLIGSTPSNSLPVNIPDWSKILKEEYRGGDGNYGSRSRMCEIEEDMVTGVVIPPHELLWKSRAASFSVQEGMGRTLKGRDLSRVRNAIFEKTGFQD